MERLVWTLVSRFTGWWSDLTILLRFMVIAPIVVWAFVGFGSALVVVLLEAGIYVWRRSRHSADDLIADVHGSARWARLSDLSADVDVRKHSIVPVPSGTRLVFGIALDEQKCSRDRAVFLQTDKGRYRSLIVSGCKSNENGRAEEGHVITVAGTGSGKGVAVVQPNLRIYEGSCVVLDPKGENFLQTYQSRERMGHRVCLVDPFSAIPPDIRSRYTARLNPLEALSSFVESERFDDVETEAAVISDMIVVRDPNDRNPHFAEKAKGLIEAVILVVTYSDVYKDRSKFPLTLGTVVNAFERWFATDVTRKAFVDCCMEHPRLRSCAAEVTMVGKEEWFSVLSTVRTHLKFLNRSAVQESVSSSDFRISDLKNGALSVYFVLPANEMSAFNRLARLWIGSTLKALMRDTSQPPVRVLLMLDEVAQLGYMQPLEQAVSLIRGYGVDLWLLFQDLAQIQHCYTERWQTFFSNAKVQQFFGVRDAETADYVCRLAGKTTVQDINLSESLSSGSSSSFSYSEQGGNSSGSSDNHTVTHSVTNVQRDLIQALEVLRLPEPALLIFMPPQHPIAAFKLDFRAAPVQQSLESWEQRTRSSLSLPTAANRASIAGSGASQ